MSALWAWMKKHLTNSWMNDADVLAQIAHFGYGALVVVTAAYLGGDRRAFGFAGAWAVYAALKEFVYDANFELPKQTWRDNVLDFSTLVGGALFGLGVVGVKHLLTK